MEIWASINQEGDHMERKTFSTECATGSGKLSELPGSANETLNLRENYLCDPIDGVS